MLFWPRPLLLNYLGNPSCVLDFDWLCQVGKTVKNEAVLSRAELTIVTLLTLSSDFWLFILSVAPMHWQENNYEAYTKSTFSWPWMQSTISSTWHLATMTKKSIARLFSKEVQLFSKRSTTFALHWTRNFFFALSADFVQYLQENFLPLKPFSIHLNQIWLQIVTSAVK